MKKIYIVGNWKSNMTESEAKNWIEGLKNNDLRLADKEIIICPPFTALSSLKSLIINNKLSLKLGAQNVSSFDKGPYTGEINASQVKEFADFAIIGHSERRKNFHEDDNILEKKIEITRKHNINPIFCIQGKDTKIPGNVEIVAYEPIFAIGTGNPDTPDNADKVARYIKENMGIKYVLYGGSVTSKNVKDFIQMPSIDGVLVGGASLDAQEFYSIIKNT